LDLNLFNDISIRVPMNLVNTWPCWSSG